MLSDASVIAGSALYDEATPRCLETASFLAVT